MPYRLEPSLSAFYRSVPKTETHLHIEGALPWELLNELHPGKYASPPESWADGYKFETFADFEGPLLMMAGDWYNSPQRYYEAALRIFQRLFEEEGVRYLETSFASGVVDFMGLDGAKVAEAIRRAAPSGMELRVFMGIHHDGYTETSRSFIDDCLNWDCLDGIDLHGTETTPMESWAVPLWEKARSMGKLTKAHAGEFMGPDFVKEIIETLGVRRIEHGVRVVEDPRLMPWLVEQGVVLDICPISNVKLSVVDRMENHPIRQLFDAGVTVTLSTDDPISFGNRLEEEYAALVQCLDFTPAEIAQVMKNGIQTADLDDGIKTSYREEIDERLQTLEINSTKNP